MKVSTKETFSIYFEHLKQYKWRFFIAFSAWTFGLVAVVINPILYKRFFDIIAGDLEVVNANSHLLMILFVVLGISLVGRVLFNTAEWQMIRLVTSMITDLSNTAFSYLHKHSYGFFSNNFVGSLVKRVNRFARGFDAVFSSFFWDAIPIIVFVIGPSIILFQTSPAISLLIFVWSIIFMLVVYVMVQYKLKYDIPKAEADSEVTAVLADTITNFINVKLFAAHKREFNFFNKVLKKREGLHRKSWGVSYHMHWVQGTLMIAIEFFAMYYALNLWTKGLITAGDIVLIQTFILLIINTLWDFSHIIRDVYENLADAEEMTEIFLTPHEIKDKYGAKPIEVHSGKISFNDISFGYNATRTILKDFSLQVQSGEKIALIGPSGAGKSTVIKLLFRYFDVNDGTITVDNQNISQVKQESLMQNISLVPQDPILFHRTLLDNIRYGTPKASKQDVIKAAKLAHAHEFIKDLPDGYNTYVGERGIKLSGGERQRVAIARAILKNAPILVLDEATSSLDSESEKLIQDALEKLMKGKTTIVVAHRLSTIMAMDRIIVMEKGQIKEEGSHEALLKKKKGIYKKLWELQAGGFLPE